MDTRWIRWGLVALVAIVAGTWALDQYRLLSSERSASAQSSATSASTVLPEIGIKAGTAASTADGAFTIRVLHATRTTVKLTVTAKKTGDVYRFDKAEVGRRLVIPAPDATYFVDLVRVRGRVVHLVMTKRE